MDASAAPAAPAARRRLLGRAAVVVAAAALVVAGALAASQRVRFILGGALVNAGYRLQDHLARYDLDHAGHDLRPDLIWDTFLQRNRLASSVRQAFPRSRYHPLIAMVVCMDARIDTNELTGDTRRFYYIIRTAGSVLGEREEEMLELAVRNGVRVVVFTTHTDCAAERAARDPAQRALYPRLVAGIAEREDREREFLSRPEIAERIRRGELIVRYANVETGTEHLVPAR